jgi:hypothetical protein
LTRASLCVVSLLLITFAGCVVSTDEEERPLPTKQRVLLRDDFSDAETGWYTGSDAAYTAAYADGRYLARVKKKSWIESSSKELGEVVEAMRVEIDAVQTTGDAADEVGVICYAHSGTTNDAGYAATIGPADHWVAIVRKLNKRSSTLEHASDVNVIRPIGPVNRIRTDCIGSRGDDAAVINLYVNGKLVARAEDNDGFPRFDGVGITTGSEEGRTQAFYDNLTVSELH